MGSTTDKATGRAKEAAGALTNDDGLRREGKVDQASGSVKEKAGDAIDSARDALTPDRDGH